MVKTKPNQKINVDKLKATLDKLDKLDEKPKSEFNLRESIYFLRDKLKSALKKGYSYQDLSAILEEQEILISAATLKQYLTDIKKKSASKKIRSRSINSQSTKSSPKKIEAISSQSKSAKTETKAKATNQGKKASFRVDSPQTKAKELSGNQEDLAGDFNQH